GIENVSLLGWRPVEDFDQQFGDSAVKNRIGGIHCGLLRSFEPSPGASHRPLPEGEGGAILGFRNLQLTLRICAISIVRILKISTFAQWKSCDRVLAAVTGIV